MVLLLTMSQKLPDGTRLIKIELTITTQNVNLDAEYARQHLNVVPGDYVMLAVDGMPAKCEPSPKKADAVTDEIVLNDPTVRP